MGHQSPVQLRISLGSHFDLVIPDLTTIDTLEQRLEPKRLFTTTWILSHRKSGVLKLDVGVLWLSRMKGTKLQQIELQDTNNNYIDLTDLTFT